MFIVWRGKQPLEKKWHVKGSPTTHEIVMQELLVETFLAENISCVLLFVVFGN